MMVKDRDRYSIVLERERRRRRWISRWWPRYRYSNVLYEDSIKERVQAGTVWVDLGCGKNDLIAELCVPGALCYGLDRAQTPETQGRPGVSFIMGDVSALPFTAESLVLLTANSVWEHLVDPERVCREAHRVLQPGGALIIRTPNRRHPLTLLIRCLPSALKRRLIWQALGVPSSEIFPTYYRANVRKELSRQCRRAGFTEVQIWAIEDIFTALGLMFLLSLLYYLLVSPRALAGWRSNFVLIAKKGLS